MQKHFLTFLISLKILAVSAQSALVLQTDFGTKDGAVAAMKGVANNVSPKLQIFDLTHEIPAYNIWEAAYRLEQTAPYWRKGTIFVSVVDPGVGTARKSIVLKTKTGHYFVTPDNGTLTLIAEKMGIAEVREINEKVNRLKNSNDSYTFFGRDVYAYTGARLAAGVISYEQVGQKLTNEIVKIPYQKAAFENGKIIGNIPILDIQYGNIWTNIDEKLFAKLNVKVGERIKIKVFEKETLKFEGEIPYQKTFGEVKEGENLAYLNSLMNLSLAINMGNFSEKYKVFSGADWKVEVSK